MNRVIAIILGGGKGTRLYPLTMERAKPAVPFAGKYRLIDIPMSNCINSGFKQIYILTQFNSASLHNHLAGTYVFDSFTHGFVEILAAEQTFQNTGWYEGTADAVRKNFLHFNTQEPTHYIILAGDQLYRLNLAEMFQHHLTTGAEITLGSTPVTRSKSSSLGIIRANDDSRVTGFVEKPAPAEDISPFAAPSSIVDTSDGGDERYLGSMGMYIFNASVLKEALANDAADFGKEIIPRSIETYRVFTYVFSGFWVDIGTIRSYYETHIELTTDRPPFNFYDEKMPIYTNRKHLPSTKLINCSIYNSLAAEGCIIREASILNSVLGIRSVVEAGTTLDGVVHMGADFFETPEQITENRALGTPNIGVGEGSAIKRAIIDTNTRIGSNCRIGIDDIARAEGAYENHYVRDGLIIIPKNSTIPDGTVL